MKPVITVAMPTNKVPESPTAALQSLVVQKTDFAYEILVLDNGCDVLLRGALESIGKCSPATVQYIPVPDPGLHCGRNAAVMHAQSDLLVYVDDDIVAAPGWLQAIVDTFRDTEAHLVGGRSLPRYEAEPPDWLEAFWSHSPNGRHSCGYLSLLDMGDESFEIDSDYIWGLNFAIRKQTLKILGGFHPDGMPWEFRRYRGDGESSVTRKAKALGLKAIYQPDALVYHCVPNSRLTVEYFERRAFLQGISNSYSAIREARGPVPLPWAPPLPEPWTVGVGRLVRKLPHYARHPRWHGRNFLRRWLAEPAPAVTVELNETAVVKERVNQAYRAGYEFHHNAVAQNADLLAWVLRENYWDCRLPDSNK